MSYITHLQAAQVRIRDLELREQVAAEAFHKMKARAEKAEAITTELVAALRPLASISVGLNDGMDDASPIIKSRSAVTDFMGLQPKALVTVGDVRHAVQLIAKATA